MAPGLFITILVSAAVLQATATSNNDDNIHSAEMSLNIFEKTPDIPLASLSTTLHIKQSSHGLTRETRRAKKNRFLKGDKETKSEKMNNGKKSGKGKGDCDPEADINLEDYFQWQSEKGYWIGDLTFLGPDGSPFQSSSWNYPYGNYRGFITGNIKGNKYRQRNVFLYPPQDPSVCETNDAVVGDGKCGVNGNTRLFQADQAATTCPEHPTEGGTLEGPFGPFDTTTTLVGKENALLYQVFMGDVIFQSQLTTLSSTDEGVNRRTRTAQGFFPAQGFSSGVPTSASFYRERLVTEEEFYAELEKTLQEYDILSSDACAADGNSGMEACRSHLDQSFEL